MMKLDNFINMMTGHFNNKEQFDNMQREGKTYPYAEHINTICNEKILNLPKDFNGKFVVEESYYETNGKRHASPHLFLITEKEDGTGYHAFFPDLEMCEADGADLEDAIENARDAAQNWISVELEEFEGDLPFATHVDDIELAENQVAKQIMVKIKFLPDSD